MWHFDYCSCLFSIWKNVWRHWYIDFMINGDWIVTPKSNPTAQYVTLHIKIDEEKSNYAHLAQENSFFPAYLYHFSNKLSNNYLNLKF